MSVLFEKNPRGLVFFQITFFQLLQLQAKEETDNNNNNSNNHATGHKFRRGTNSDRKHPAK
jgi:hypothetical protein